MGARRVSRALSALACLPAACSAEKPLPPRVPEAAVASSLAREPEERPALPEQTAAGEGPVVASEPDAWEAPVAGDGLGAALPGYEPKRTPDTLVDYRPSLGARLAALPPADPAHLGALLAAFVQAWHAARERPGHREPGNVLLGADPTQYVPSDEELVESELGSRVARALASASRSQRDELLAGKQGAWVVYGEIAVRHADVMGSGRFFYASEPVRRRVAIHERSRPK